MNTFSARFPPLLYGKPRGEALQIVQSFFHFFQSRRGIWRPVPGCCIFAAFFMTMTRKTRRPARCAVRGAGCLCASPKVKGKFCPAPDGEAYLAQKKANPQHKTCCGFDWRRWRDLNSRAGFPTYSLSRGASSPLEYISMAAFITRMHLSALKTKWRKGWDSNPRNIAAQRFSRPPP